MPSRTDKAVQEYLRRIELEIERVESELAQLHATAASFRFTLERFSDDDEAPSVDGSPASTAMPAEAGSRVRAETKLVRNTLFEVIRSSDRPMHARDLLAALDARGVEVNGKDRVNNVRAHLSHDTGFKSVGSGEWDLLSRVSERAARTAEAGTLRQPSADDSSTAAGNSKRVGSNFWGRPIMSPELDDTESPNDDGPTDEVLRQLEDEYDRVVDRPLAETLPRLAYGDMDDVPF